MVLATKGSLAAVALGMMDPRPMPATARMMSNCVTVVAWAVKIVIAAQDLAHPFKHVRGRYALCDGLQPARQDVERVKDRRDRLDQKRYAPGEGFGGLTPAHDERRRDHPNRPAHQQQIRKQRNERETHLKQVPRIQPLLSMYTCSIGVAMLAPI